MIDGRPATAVILAGVHPEIIQACKKCAGPLGPGDEPVDASRQRCQRLPPGCAVVVAAIHMGVGGSPAIGNDKGSIPIKAQCEGMLGRIDAVGLPELPHEPFPGRAAIQTANETDVIVEEKDVRVCGVDGKIEKPVAQISAIHTIRKNIGPGDAAIIAAQQILPLVRAPLSRHIHPTIRHRISLNPDSLRGAKVMNQLPCPPRVLTAGDAHDLSVAIDIVQQHRPGRVVIAIRGDG